MGDTKMKLYCDQDLLHINPFIEKTKHKRQQLVQSPRSYFLDVKCPGCLQIITLFSHSQTIMFCESCGNVISVPTGGLCRLTEGVSYRVKAS